MSTFQLGFLIYSIGFVAAGFSLGYFARRNSEPWPIGRFLVLATIWPLTAALFDGHYVAYRVSK